MKFRDRTEAGILLSYRLEKYRGEDIVIYALPRGGVIAANEIAKHLHAPLGIVIAKKIGHPHNPEYAIAAIAENGHIIGEKNEMGSVSKEWLKEEIKKERIEAKRRRETYLAGGTGISAQGKVAILVDDGVATGLTIRVGIKELRSQKPKKIIIAVPVIPESVALQIEGEVDELVALTIPPDNSYLGSVASYYEDFPQVSDKEVVAVLRGGSSTWIRLQ